MLTLIMTDSANRSQTYSCCFLYKLPLDTILLAGERVYSSHLLSLTPLERHYCICVFATPSVSCQTLLILSPIHFPYLPLLLSLAALIQALVTSCLEYCKILLTA